jgi:hypothetical protein
MRRSAARFAECKLAWNTILVVASLAGCLLILEYALRLTLGYHIDFYASERRSANTVLHFPYGEIPINSAGEADSEFNFLSKKERIGYFGDSVNFGVGAGYPYRFSELVEQAFPQYEHWNVGSESGAGIPLYMPDKVRRYNLKYAVYLLNLNDIAPASSIAQPAQTNILPLKKLVKNTFDWMRDKSYLYNYVRFKIKNAMAVWLGFDASGYLAYELWPSKFEQFFEHAAAQINELAQETQDAGAELCILLLPYEMQISRPAEAMYEALGFTWEDEFPLGKPQAILKALLDSRVHVHDPRQGFAPFEAPVGTFFVYNKGDKLDWNHPNRDGHRMLSDSFLGSRDCPFLRSRTEAEPWTEFPGR